jgi:hypothetical protein
LKSFGGGAEGGPPTGASFLEKEEFSSVLGADKAGWDDFGVIEYEKVSGGKEGGEVSNREIGDLVCGTAEEKKAGGVAGISWGGGNSIVGDIDR